MRTDPNLATKLQAKNILNADYAGKNIVIRTVLNVAVDKQGNITDFTRIEESVPTLQTLAQKAKRIVIMAHLGRPTSAGEPEFSLEVVRKELEKRLQALVTMLNDEAALDDVIASPQSYPNKYYLVENIRYFAGEESKDLLVRQAFAQKLAGLGDIYVNDAFADYREAASTFDLANYLPAYIGPVFVKELIAISYFAQPAKPFIAILGGAKLSEKLDALLALLKQADSVLVGGAMAYTLLLSQGTQVGKSLVELDKLEVAREIMKDYKDKLLLPVDHVVVSEFSDSAVTEVIDGVSIPEGKIAVDIGPKTQALFAQKIAQAGAILWNGPMGVFEWASTEAGTRVVVNAILVNPTAYKFAGGGDSIAAINKFRVSGFDHVSTGGGAMLAFVSYDKFPTLDAIIK